MPTNPACQIHRFEERDIDLFLAEELRINTAFAAWFAARVAPSRQLEVPALRTRVSVVEDGSEADVVACFGDGDGGVHRIYVEDKITAPMMLNQLSRYLRRALAEAERNEITGYSVVLFAPAAYSTGLPEGVARVTFEEAAVALRNLSAGPRSDYRAALLEGALRIASSVGRDARTAEVEPYVAAWWDEVYRMLDREFPAFFLSPRIRYPRSVYFAPRTAGMPDYIRVDFKGHKGEVDLAFKDLPIEDLAAFLAGMDAPGQLVENGRSSAIRVAGLTPFRIADGHAIIATHVRAAYAAAQTLLTFWRRYQGTFDSLVARTVP